MPAEGQVIRIARDDDIGTQRVAADIWARATARRDNNSQPAAAADKLLGIRRSLAVDGASLHVARQGEASVGFALLIAHEHVVEVLYLGVDPATWGVGVGTRLVEYIEEYARATGHSSLELWVIHDNERAVRVYERLGWISSGDAKVRNASGRLERHFFRRLD